jgi:hypothetical protein
MTKRKKSLLELKKDSLKERGDLIAKENSIVIARYREDISWSYVYRDICVIYNKGPRNLEYQSDNVVQLNNVGREAHTYLYHIINHWDTLANMTLFTQGNIIDHIGSITDLRLFFDKRFDFIANRGSYTNCYDPISGRLIHCGKWLGDLETGTMRKASQSFLEWCKIVLRIDFQGRVIFFPPGAIFSVTKELIHKKPLSFYKYLLSFLEDHVNPEEGHYFERTWVYIFCNPHSKIATLHDNMLLNIRTVSD